ncbi:MAG: FeoC-like transcriptional regulator [Nanoarchaeota archaeon]|nr:FeoC-like transcriptional regulator [Nanoarchaeota archaeon]
MFPSEKELIDFIKKREFVNFSMIARHFDIKNAAVSDFVALLEKKKVLRVKKMGGSKFVLLK